VRRKNGQLPGAIKSLIMELLDTLKANVEAELAQCERGETPYICANTQSAEGRQKMVNLIVRRVIEQHITVSEAIVEIEVELNPNSYIN
jgi:hypothetical protein